MPLALALGCAEDALRRALARLLSKDGYRGKKRRAERHGKKIRSKGFHWVVNSWKEVTSSLTYAAGEFA